MEEEVDPEAGGGSDRNGQAGGHGSSRLSLTALDPVVPNVRRVADYGGEGTAWETTGQDCQEVTFGAVRLD